MTGTIERLSGLLREKKVSCRELTQAYLDGIARDNSVLNAYVRTTKEQALETAETVDRKIAAGELLSPLEGIPMTIKDNISTRGIETTCCSKILQGYTPIYDATVWQTLKQQNAVLLGKTNMDEFAFLSNIPYIPSVYAYGALGHIIEPGYQLAQGSLSASRRAYESHGLSGSYGKIHVMKHILPAAVGKGHIPYIYASLYIRKLRCSLSVLKQGLGTHDLKETPEACTSVCQHLRIRGKIPYRSHKGGHIKRKCYQVHHIHAALHDKRSADGYDRYGKQAHEELHGSLEHAHGLMVSGLGIPEGQICPVEFSKLHILICKGLCCLYP